ncbi:MAG: NUDIX domain-containing protein [Pseudomonadota bacterium]
MTPRFGQPPRRGVVYRRRPGAYAILLGRRGVLLTRQVTPDLDELQLPGGGIDPGEAVLPALIREVREETGHSCRIDRRLATFRQYSWMPDYNRHAEKMCHVYLGRAGPRLGPPEEAGHSAIWCSLEAALAGLSSPGNRAVLTRFALSTRLRPRAGY